MASIHHSLPVSRTARYSPSLPPRRRSVRLESALSCARISVPLAQPCSLDDEANLSASGRDRLATLPSSFSKVSRSCGKTCLGDVSKLQQIPVHAGSTASDVSTSDGVACASAEPQAKHAPTTKAVCKLIAEFYRRTQCGGTTRSGQADAVANTFTIKTGTASIHFTHSNPAGSTGIHPSRLPRALFADVGTRCCLDELLRHELLHLCPCAHGSSKLVAAR